MALDRNRHKHGCKAKKQVSVELQMGQGVNKSLPPRVSIMHLRPITKKKGNGNRYQHLHITGKVVMVDIGPGKTAVGWCTPKPVNPAII